MLRRIFRQTALDRLSSPDQLDRLMQVITPRGWIALLALCCLIVATLVWSVWGSIPTTVLSRGILLPVKSVEQKEAPSGATLRVVAFIPVEASSKIKPGMPVRISPATIRAEEYGYILGQTSSISDLPVTKEQMMSILENELLVQHLSGGQIHYTLEVNLEQNPDTYTGLRWSSPGGPPVPVRRGTLCEVRVVVEERRPISLALPIMRSVLSQ